MDIQPYEYMVIDFPGGKLTPEMAQTLQQLTASGAIHIVDMTFIRKDAGGHIESLELSQLAPEEAAAYENLDGEIDDLINEDDIQAVAANLPLDCIAAVLVWEDVWATQLANMAQAAHAQVVANERIPRSIIEAALHATVTTPS